MFRIQRVMDTYSPRNKTRIEEALSLIRAQFPGVAEDSISAIPQKLENPFRDGFRYILFVAEGARSELKGCALLSYSPQLGFCYLDYVCAGKNQTGGGIGGALYDRLRQEAQALKTIGIFFECLPDDPLLSPNPKIRKQNEARLRFYENYGAYPIANTQYETPLSPEDSDPPYLVFDALGSSAPLRKNTAKRIVRAILDAKYAAKCPAHYVSKVIDSFVDDPVRLRPPKYLSEKLFPSPPLIVPQDKKIPLLVNDQHSIHHVRERGYVEAPIRIDSVLKKLEASGIFFQTEVKHFGEKHIQAIHNRDYIDYFKRVCSLVGSTKSLYPYVFPIRNQSRPPKELPVRAGYYCIDTFTPLNKNAFLAAKRAVDCTLTAAQCLLEGHPLVYALVRPPGHHAERSSFGGFCYFNNAAAAAQYLSPYGKVAILDLDYHHGNGQQQIFYERCDVLTVSIHGHPRFAYPYFSGFEDELGAGNGAGYNFNLALGEHVDGVVYRAALKKALKKVASFSPRFLIICLGLDTAKGDPTGTWTLGTKDLAENARMAAKLRLPTLVVQEGGYRTRNLGVNALSFLRAFWETLA